VVELKGQLTIQYLASFIFFIGLIVYIYFAYSANLPAFVEEVRKEDVRSKAFQLSEVLVNDPGDPADWGPADPNRIGLSDENSNKPNLISKRKVDKLGLICSNFDDVQQKLALDKPFSIYVFEIDQTTGNRNQLLGCASPDFPKTTINATIKRITALEESGNLKLAELIVQM